MTDLEYLETEVAKLVAWASSFPPRKAAALLELAQEQMLSAMFDQKLKAPFDWSVEASSWSAETCKLEAE